MIYQIFLAYECGCTGTGLLNIENDENGGPLYVKNPHCFFYDLKPNSVTKYGKGFVYQSQFSDYMGQNEKNTSS